MIHHLCVWIYSVFLHLVSELLIFPEWSSEPQIDFRAVRTPKLGQSAEYFLCAIYEQPWLAHGWPWPLLCFREKCLRNFVQYDVCLFYRLVTSNVGSVPWYARSLKWWSVNWYGWKICIKFSIFGINQLTGKICTIRFSD